jgi:WS/DGAT/MGAT family acyltransferase
MSDLQAVKVKREVSLNDVVLAIVAGGLRRYLDGAHEQVDGVHPRVIVPVSQHGGTDHELENRFSIMVGSLPIAVDDPVERLRLVHEEMVRHKAAASTSVAPLLFRAGDLVPTPVLHALAPTLLRHQPLVNTAVTNIPGTTEPLYLLGARLLEMYPLITVTGNLGVIVGVLSYEDGLGVGITVDADVVTDVDDLAAAMDAAASELIDACRSADRSALLGPVTAAT